MFITSTPPTSLVYTLQFGSPTITLSDSTTYYVGTSVVAAQTVANILSIPIPKGGTIVYADIGFTSAAPGTSETFSAYIRINNTTDVLISSSLTITANGQRFSNSALAQAVVAGDFFEVKVVTPAWATNPTTIRIYGTIMIQV